MKKVMSAEDRAAALAALALMSDDQIDTTSIPEASEESWLTARRGGGRPVRKQSVTLRLSPEIVGWFKAQCPDGGYQTAMNEALEAHILRSHAPAPHGPIFTVVSDHPTVELAGASLPKFSSSLPAAIRRRGKYRQQA
jgi:uncharacterized protein (DUF4415 family)